VISMAVVYIMGLVMSAMFLITRKFLRARQGSGTSKAERCLYSLSGISLPWAMTLAPMVFAMELVFAFTIPIQNWPQTIEFFNEVESSSAFLFEFPIMFMGITLVSFVIGYFDNPRGMYDTVTALRDQWLWILLVLYVAVGIVGAMTGLLA
jgi:ABC-type multidrug transport system permease subunit